MVSVPASAMEQKRVSVFGDKSHIPIARIDQELQELELIHFEGTETLPQITYQP